MTIPIPPSAHVAKVGPRLVPIEFSANGHRYRQIKRDGLVTLYSVGGKAGHIYGYEVAVLNVRKATPARAINGRSIPASLEREIYPGNEDFGVRGWYYQDQEDAERRYEETLEWVRSSVAQNAG